MSKPIYISGTTSGRMQSPAVEVAVSKAIHELLRELMESKGLYQNLALSPPIFQEFSSEKFSAKDYEAEFSTRPWHICALGQGGPHGSSALGTPDDQLPLDFYAPAINLLCSTCKAPSSFRCLHSERQYDSLPYPLISSKTKQLYTLHFQCVTCNAENLAYQIKRHGLKIQLTGRSTMFMPEIEREWPKKIQSIVKDSILAASEGDISAGYYHLRTALEHFLKQTLEIPIETKSEGDSLCDRYNDTLDDDFKQRFPSLRQYYSELSQGLHSRKVKADRLTEIRGQILDHFKAKKLWEKYSSKITE